MSKKTLFLLVAMIIGASFFAGVQFSLAEDAVQPSITVLSPNGGEIWNTGSTHTITWTTLGVPNSNTVDLSLKKIDGNETTLINGFANTGSYIFTVPSVQAGSYIVRVRTLCRTLSSSCATDYSVDYSDVPFTITAFATQPSVTILSPNGGETYKNDGSSITVNWQTNNVPASHVIDIIRLRVYPSGREYNLATNVLNDGQEVVVPASIPVGAYTLEMKTYLGEILVMDSSDSYFKIVDVFQSQTSATVPSTEVKEQVKCIFKGATSEQKCNTATDDSSSYSGYGCSGTESCVIDMKGINGDKITWKSSCGGYAYSVMDGSSDYAIFYCATPTIATPTITTTPTTVKEKAEQILDINEKSKLISNNNFDFILAELNQLRSIIKEQQTEIKYLTSLVKDVKDLSEKSQDAITNFITYGVDVNTEKLGAGERAAVINSYKAAFDKLPETEAELSDAIKIANGRFPTVTSSEAEKTAKEQFVKIYKRAVDLNDANDNAAIKVMAYGLRQKAENRNLNSEKAGIKIFKNIFGSVPKTTEDWNTMQAITYSGATR